MFYTMWVTFQYQNLFAVYVFFDVTGHPISHYKQSYFKLLDIEVDL